MNMRPARVLSDAHSTRSCHVHHFMEPTYPCVVPITHACDDTHYITHYIVPNHPCHEGGNNVESVAF